MYKMYTGFGVIVKNEQIFYLPVWQVALTEADAKMSIINDLQSKFPLPEYSQHNTVIMEIPNKIIQETILVNLMLANRDTKLL